MIPFWRCTRIATPVVHLQAGDKEFKEELGKIVNTDVWEAAKDEASAQLQDVQKDIDMLTQRQEYDQSYYLEHSDKVTSDWTQSTWLIFLDMKPFLGLLLYPFHNLSSTLHEQNVRRNNKDALGKMTHNTDLHCGCSSEIQLPQVTSKRVGLVFFWW